MTRIQALEKQESLTNNNKTWKKNVTTLNNTRVNLISKFTGYRRKGTKMLAKLSCKWLPRETLMFVKKTSISVTD